MSLDKKNILNTDLERRKFLLDVLKKSGQVVMATGFVYSINLIANKNSMRAGAK